MSDKLETTVAYHCLEKKYMLPRQKTVDSTGNIFLRFSSEIEVPNLTLVSTELSLNRRGLEASTDVIEIDKLMKETESLSLTLLTNNLEVIEYQGFTWQIVRFEKGLLNIQMYFENPEVISYYMIDTIQVKFENTPYFLNPKDKDLQPTPNGFKIDVKMPP